MSVSSRTNAARPPEAAAPRRLASLDAYRGFVMLLMMAEVLRLHLLTTYFPESGWAAAIAALQSHVPWEGCHLHDLIQPSFSFLVGVALPFSLASRLARGESTGRMAVHAVWRAVVLVLLGVFLRSVGEANTNWTFEDTLTQIGLGYPFLFLLGFCRTRTQWIVFGIILVGYWFAWAAYPLPPGAHEFAAHWNPGANLGVAFDRWFLNLFPREQPFVANDGGYVTLNFIPTLGTMLLGVIAGEWLRSERSEHERVQMFLVMGLLGIALGLALHGFGICPLVKRVWTPSWVLFSGGCCFVLLAAFHAVIDRRGYRSRAFPLIVVGTNSIAAYCIAELMGHFIGSSLTTHFGGFHFIGGPIVKGVLILLIYWLVLFWMFRRKLFLKI
ncbi:MAG: hypothetical protein JWM88_3172 [Verrucomicrobia bacterium]|nr:hypothetical protein [Verrucomicrobiota bacterium]